MSDSTSADTTAAELAERKEAYRRKILSRPINIHEEIAMLKKTKKKPDLSSRYLSRQGQPRRPEKEATANEMPGLSAYFAYNLRQAQAHRLRNMDARKIDTVFGRLCVTGHWPHS